MHIIIVDAHDEYLQLQCAYLGYHLPRAILTPVHSAEAALTLYESHGADLVITAHQLPLRSGVELIQELRKRAQQLAIIMHTSIVAVEKEAYAAGADRFVVKGTSLWNLVDAIEDVLPATAFA
jgi:two-component system, NarL family, response regulator, fimbrial Z protein, FimZ